MYDRNQTEASKSALVELSSALNSYRNDLVLSKRSRNMAADLRTKKLKTVSRSSKKNGGL